MISQWIITSLVIGVILVPVKSYATTLEVNIGFMDGGGLVVQQEVESFTELRQRNVVLQERDYSCGSAALATLLHYFLDSPVQEIEIIRTLLELNKKRGTLEKVIQQKGFSLLDLKLFAESKGFKAAGYRLDFEDLVKLGVPAIVPVIPEDYKHFVVFRGTEGQRVYLADPSIGNITESIEEFKRDWYGFTNVALVVLPPEGKKIERHPMALSELDKVFAGQEDIDSLLGAGLPLRPFIPGEF